MSDGARRLKRTESKVELRDNCLNERKTTAQLKPGKMR